MSILCIDIGNTRLHLGYVEGQRVSRTEDLPTRELAQLLPQRLAEADFEGVAYCSVVPAATTELEECLRAAGVVDGVRLDHAHCPGLAISYPHPPEIGPDRLANGIGAQVICGAPAIVIDTGTATTFDLVTRADGYIGGIIAPGPAMMTKYLHEKTALLPELSLEELKDPGRIGRSTRDAMKLGCVVGYGGMIRALLERSREEFAARGEELPAVLATGGGTVVWLDQAQEPIRQVPYLSLLGLAEAWRRSGESV
ncbi:type III pantothenate kinase [Ruficoccus amylovorans]|uniref:Type III pantothenate kinase n=1 Tax=Ruficoccus amylovorans TaxID=1804625 RepID=A0A842HMJ8_9BACT|nr:type III pantothenate kinase [Ruficoccus amylovorans]MBC2596311.1 type III pantothenate kinase [Ruficoccus amylovorans]